MVVMAIFFGIFLPLVVLAFGVPMVVYEKNKTKTATAISLILVGSVGLLIGLFSLTIT